MELKLIVISLLAGTQVLGADLFGQDESTIIRPDASMWLDKENIPEIDFAVESVASKVKFYLYTREYDEDYLLVLNDADSIKNSTFNASRPTKVAIHGYEHNYQYEAVQFMRIAYLNYSSQDVNVIGVEWSKLCEGPPKGFYVEAYLNVPRAGKVLGQFLDFLITETGANASDFHLIGHSLGAHLAAFAANTMTVGSISRISGLDAAMPLYNFVSTSHRLDPTDADIVDCIHTCGGALGFYKPLGTHDFYPNGGKPPQPGCGLDLQSANTELPRSFQHRHVDLQIETLWSCSHERVVRLFAESVFDTFNATGCSAFSDVKARTCNGTNGVMGDPAPNSAKGIYYLETNSAYPYAKNSDSE